MTFFPIFLSVVVVVRNNANQLQPLLEEAGRLIAASVSEYELIVVDNASEDDSLRVLKKLTGPDGLPNLQVYGLTKEVDMDAAFWVGLENALGDFCAVLDPLVDDIKFLPSMLEKISDGTDVVFARNTLKPRQGLVYRFAFNTFNALYKLFNGVHLADEAPQYRLINKRVINFILQHQMPATAYRYLPATGGFTREMLSYSSQPQASSPKKLSDAISRGLRLLVSSTGAPMRLVTTLSFTGAVLNLLYSVYVIAIALVKSDVAPGWVTLSLQQSGMFFLISLVLMVLGEYISHLSSGTNAGPLYHVAQGFTSAVITRRQKLNIEVVES